MSGFLPPSTNAAYRGARISVGFLALAAVLTIGPGLIHAFAPDGGIRSIAGLEPGAQYALVRAVFAWEGATQLALGLAMAVVAWRYRPLTPFFLALVILDRGLMSLQAWVWLPPASGHHPPEHYGSPIAVALAAIFLVLSLRPRSGA